MFIEFLGAPGTGKTTLVSVVNQFLRDHGLKAMTVSEAGPFYVKRTHLGRIICFLVRSPSLQRSVLWWAFYYSTVLYRIGFAIEHAALVRHVVASQLRRPILWRHRRLILQHFLRATGYYQFLKRHMRPDEILVFDEGFLHRVTHLFVSELEQPDPACIVEYLELLPRTDLVILVQASLCICVERIYTRGLTRRLSGKSRQDVNRFIANAEQVVNMASQYLKNAGREMIEIENNGDLNACVADLHNDLEKFLVCH
jgi:thymidylate kinase